MSSIIAVEDQLVVISVRESIFAGSSHEVTIEVHSSTVAIPRVPVSTDSLSETCLAAIRQTLLQNGSGDWHIPAVSSHISEDVVWAKVSIAKRSSSGAVPDLDHPLSSLPTRVLRCIEQWAS